MQYTIKRPLITEKNSWLAEQGVYVFEVDKAAEKPEIKKAVEKFFSVKVADVRTAICRGRAKRSRTGGMSYPSKWKKAWVRLEPGQKIGLFEGA
jgi:large subunit ribosomal protein L23